MGTKEVRAPKTRKNILSTKLCIVFLHENHRAYFSSSAKSFTPFLVTSHLADDRRSIQDYFSATYGLEVSVRPSFGQAHYDGQPAHLYHAQIQTGNHTFSQFGKEEKEGWMKGNEEV